MNPDLVGSTGLDAYFRKAEALKCLSYFPAAYGVPSACLPDGHFLSIHGVPPNGLDDSS
jgi:hypothetical protein